MATVTQVAQWMVDTVLKEGYLQWGEAIQEIERRFGEEFIDTDNRLSLSADVRKEVQKLGKGKIGWSRSEQCWRKRKPEDHSNKWQLD